MSAMIETVDLVICAATMPAAYPSLVVACFRTTKEPYRYFYECDEPDENGVLQLEEMSPEMLSRSIADGDMRLLDNPIQVQHGYVLVLLERGIEYIPKEDLRGRLDEIFKQSLTEAEELFKSADDPWQGLETLMLRAGQARFTDAEQLSARVTNTDWTDAETLTPTLWAAARAHPEISQILG
jgi:hypothetical protein